MPNLPAKGAGGHAGGAPRGGPGGRILPGKTQMINLLCLLCLRAGGASLAQARAAAPLRARCQTLEERPAHLGPAGGLSCNDC
eukprot:15431633-Alexandrium_andersonii.AAC.1